MPYIINDDAPNKVIASSLEFLNFNPIKNDIRTLLIITKFFELKYFYLKCRVVKRKGRK